MAFLGVRVWRCSWPRGLDRRWGSVSDAASGYGTGSVLGLDLGYGTGCWHCSTSGCGSWLGDGAWRWGLARRCGSASGFISASGVGVWVGVGLGVEVRPVVLVWSQGLFRHQIRVWVQGLGSESGLTSRFVSASWLGVRVQLSVRVQCLQGGSRLDGFVLLGLSS